LFKISKIDSQSLSEQKVFVSRLKTLENKKINYHYSGKSTAKIDKQIQQLEEDLSQDNRILLSGKITYLLL